MRDVLDVTLKASEDRYAVFANKINGQYILLIDDTISRRQSLREACRIMNEPYAAYCGKQFVKKQYSRAFCCDECRNNYHNKNDYKRKTAARERLDKLDEKRWRERMRSQYGYIPSYDCDPEEDDHVSEQLDIYS